MSRLANINVLLGVTGGIAAYKAAEVTRLLRAEGAAVRVAMTSAATKFVAPLTFQALSGHRVHLNLLDAAEESAMDHISLARWAHVVAIVPATADFIGRLRAGLADDLLTTLCLVSEAPMLLAPAMNRSMWEHPATRDNVRALQSRGANLVGPARGALACGETGEGRLAEPVEIVEALTALAGSGPLEGVSVMVTAGPTREPIDPVRFIGNRSSGRMGYAVAAAAAALGARVTLVSGPTALSVPARVDLHRVETADQMYHAVMDLIAGQDIYIGAAAVADYTPARLAAEKIKKTDADLTLALVRTRDIVGDVAALAKRPFVVGFAAETQDLERYARTKLTAKGLDMIAANRVGAAEGGFDSEDNALEVYWADGSRHLPMAPKPIIAKQLMDLIVERVHAKNSTQDTR